MAIINLEKFSPKKTVTIPGSGEYTINLFTVGDFIEGKAETVIPESADQKESAKALVKFIMDYSDIPEDVLLKQGLGMLTALSVLIQGGEIDTKEDGGKGNA